MPETNLAKFKKLLSELFMLDRADLDFGIYRIMNSKRDEITRFLDKDLLPQVRDELSKLGTGDQAQLEQDYQKALEQAKRYGAPDPESAPPVIEARTKLETSVDVAAAESEVFSHLFNFFRRYYSEGDFLSLRRYKEGVYAIPYEGEEVKLYWANADQYYIKTSENFRDYTFKLPPFDENARRVHFKLVSADTEQNNNKAAEGDERRFILSETEPLAEEGGELFIRFEYRPDAEKRKQAELNAEAVRRILNAEAFAHWTEALGAKAPTEKNPNRTLLEKHLNDYTSRNTFDYFIHKDLGGFLRRELDFYIKNEVMHLDDIESETAPRVEQYLGKVRAIRRLAFKLIAFLEQLENFEKKLWLKKKFVVETNYCVTLDRVPEDLYAEIAANNAQREEWVRLFAINEFTCNPLTIKDFPPPPPAFSVPLTLEFLKANPFLVLDTKFFGREFKNRFLASFENLDEQTDGLLIESENFHALNLIQERYREQIRCIYIDPPYNTGPSEIIYKNTYKHSSWASLISNRVRLARSLKKSKGVMAVAIDDNELVNLWKLLEADFPDHDVTPVVVVHNPRGNITNNFAKVHEYALFLTEKWSSSILRTIEESGSLRKMRRWGENSRRTDRPTMFYPIYVKDEQITRIGDRPDDSFHPTGKNVKIETGETEIWPIDQDGVERRWNFGLDSIHQNLDRIVVSGTDGLLDLFVSAEKSVPKTVWSGGEFDAGKYGNNLLISIIGQKLFSFPKSINNVAKCLDIVCREDETALVLDFFGGSGTTGHAVINLNREHGGRRKFILAEMGEYFDSVLKTRIQKVAYSKDWRDGKPVSREGSSHLFKYIRLESYEDALNNIEMRRNAEQASLLEAHEDFREDYVLRYMLDVEARGSAGLLNVESFADPFNYQLNVATGASVGETRPVAVDLVETFNYLLGLRVQRVETVRAFRVVRGTNPEGEKVLVIWRNTREKSNDDLDQFFSEQGYNTRDREFDIIYTNGDNNLENLRRLDETWKVRLIEESFQRLMFDVQDV